MVGLGFSQSSLPAPFLQWVENVTLQKHYMRWQNKRLLSNASDQTCMNLTCLGLVVLISVGFVYLFSFCVCDDALILPPYSTSSWPWKNLRKYHENTLFLLS